MIAYASNTGNRRNLASLARYGWRILTTPGRRPPLGFAYALDNGAWGAHVAGCPLDLEAFARALAQVGPGADWVVAPDIVCGGAASWALSREWLPRCLDSAPRVLIAVQPEIPPEEVAAVLGPRVGVFVGGDTRWKLETMPRWANLARSASAWCHVGRVNTARRISACALSRVDSFDGSGASRFQVTHRRLSLARDQLALTF